VLYARVSTEEQKRKETIQAQRTAAQGWSQRTGIPIQRVYADEGVSGTIPFEKRPEGKRLLEDARAGKFNTVIFRELERIGRDVEPIHLARKLLENVDLTLVSITEGFDLSTLGGEVHYGEPCPQQRMSGGETADSCTDNDDVHTCASSRSSLSFVTAKQPRPWHQRLPVQQRTRTGLRQHQARQRALK
jgi:hypothetical protein